MRYLTVFLFFLMVGCGSGSAKTPGDGGPNGTDTSSATDGIEVATDGSEVAADGPCTGSLEQVQTAAFHLGPGPACPTTYGEAMQMPPVCGPDTRLVTFKPCGGFLVLLARCFVHGFYCAYDAVSLALVGAAAFDDIPTFCQRRSFCIQGGTLPAEFECTSSGQIRHSCIVDTVDGGGGTTDGSRADVSDGPTAE